jgi:hypothetical protein
MEEIDADCRNNLMNRREKKKCDRPRTHCSQAAARMKILRISCRNKQFYRKMTKVALAFFCFIFIKKKFQVNETEKTRKEIGENRRCTLKKKKYRKEGIYKHAIIF